MEVEDYLENKIVTVFRVIYMILLVVPSATLTHGSHGSAVSADGLHTQFQKITTTPKKKIIFIAGIAHPSKGEHQYRAGCLMLASLLNKSNPDITTIVCEKGWPDDHQILQGASTIVLYSNGGDRHVVIAHLKELDSIMMKGTGLVVLHPAIEPPLEARAYFLNWLGGYFEPYYSVNPRWTASFNSLPKHAILNGVHPFQLRDEWYYNLRFVSDRKPISPLLTAIPPLSSIGNETSAYGGNPSAKEVVIKQEPQILAWAFTRLNGGRSVGCSGGHYHKNWNNDNFRKLVLNAILWTANISIRSQGFKKL